METRHRTTGRAFDGASPDVETRKTTGSGGASLRERRGFAGLSSFSLKLIAIIGMTFNHAAYVFYPYLPFGARCVMLAVGGVTFPIMAFLLVEGYRHTSNLKRYACRLAVFAAVAQVPYWLFLSHTGNVLFTLLLSLAALRLYDTVSNRPLFWALFALVTAISALCDWGVLGPIMVLAAHTLRGSASACDGSRFGRARLSEAQGVAALEKAGAGAPQQVGVAPRQGAALWNGADLRQVGAVAPRQGAASQQEGAAGCQGADPRHEAAAMPGHAAEARRAWRQGIVVPTLIPLVSTGASELSAVATDIAALPFFLYAAVGNTAAMGLLLAYNGKRGRPMKWFFYAYYPAHIAVLGIAKGFVLGDWSLGF